jgi:hypothetical protein
MSKLNKDEDFKIDDDFGLDDDIREDLNDGSFDTDIPFNDFGGIDDSQTTMQKYGDLLKELTNFDTYLKDMLADWLGVEWDSKQQKWVPDEDAEERINKKGVKAILSFLKIYARKNNIITNVSEEEFRWIHQDLINETYTIFPCSAEYYGIKREEDLMVLCHQVYSSALLVMFGAGDGKYTTFLGQTTMRHENVSYQNMGENDGNGRSVMARRKKPGIMQKLGGMLKGG